MFTIPSTYIGASKVENWLYIGENWKDSGQKSVNFQYLIHCLSVYTKMAEEHSNIYIVCCCYRCQSQLYYHYYYYYYYY